MRRLLGLKDSANTHPTNFKGKERQRDSTPPSIPLPDSSSSSHAPMEVHVSTEVHSAPDRLGFHPLTSTVSLASDSPTSSDSRPLPPDIRVPTHPYPYWQGYTHTPSSSSQSSLESPMTPSHVSWLSSGNANAQGYPNSSHTDLSLTNPQPSAGASSSSHSLLHGRSSPSPHFPPPPPTNPPPNVVARPKLIHPTKSSHSLRVPVQEFFNQQLSPIVEQDYLSPEKRPVSLPSSSHDGGGSRSSTAHTARTSAALTPVSPVSDGIGSATVTPVTPVPITPMLATARAMPTTPQMQTQTPVTPSYPGGVVPFARTKEEEGNDSPRPSPVSTFILRPLNRSISLSSTRTHQTTASTATPPVIPPLDLKPEFKGQTFLTTPTSLHSRGLLDIPIHDDDSVSDKRESFVTARTGAGRESRYSLGQDEVFVDAEEGYIRDSSGTLHPFDFRLLEDNTDVTPTPVSQPIPENSPKPIKPPVPARTVMHPCSASRSSSPPSYNYPPGPQSSDTHLHPGLHHYRPTPASSTIHPSRLGVSAPSLQDLGSSVSTSSSFIDRRFAPSSLYLPPASERESAHRAGAAWRLRLERVDTIQVLFWLGFVAPWCWLIGGWLVDDQPRLPPPGRVVGTYENGHTASAYGHGGARGGTLPLWTTTGTSKNKSMVSFDTVRVHGYPFVAPSASSLMPPPPPYRMGIVTESAVVLVPKVVGTGRKNRWVRRCRIAAVVSGIVLVIAFLVALIVALTSRVG